MTSLNDVVPVPESPSYAQPPFDHASRHAAHTADELREINERRARVENPEMLRRLRGLKPRHAPPPYSSCPDLFGPSMNTGERWRLTAAPPRSFLPHGDHGSPGQAGG